MQNKVLTLVLLFALANFSTLKAQYSAEFLEEKRCFVGSSSFILVNLLGGDESPDFLQLNLGYRLTEKDVISLEAITWRYFEPLGIPNGESKNDVNENFPGFIREKGLAIAYQRFLWKGLYTAAHVMGAWQKFANTDGTYFDDGFQIFNTYRLGYHIKIAKGKFFIEPSIAITHRPYHTKMPAGFKQMDDKWSKFFFGEPGLHFGFNF